MRSSLSLAPLVCGFASAVFLSAIVLIAPGSVHAQEKPPRGSTCSCPEATEPDPAKPTPRPKFAEVRPALGLNDEIATLEALHVALSEVGDGSTYVWHSRQGRLSGHVKPTQSFRDASGKICRHIVVTLAAESFARSTEGIACRLANGSWQLEG